MIAVGVGASRGCPPSELSALVEAALDAAGAPPEDVGVLASADVKADEPAVLALATARGWPLRTYAAGALAAVPVPTPSLTVARHVGTPSVAEAAALLAAAPARLLLRKQRSAHATCAIAMRTPAEGSRGGSPAHASGDPPRCQEEGSRGGSTAHASGHPPRGWVGLPTALVYAATTDCRGCGACLKTCPERALRPAPPWFAGPPLLTLVDRCTGCGECHEICPADAFVALPPEEAPWPA